MSGDCRPLCWAVTILVASSASAQPGIGDLSVATDAKGAYRLESRFFVEASSATARQVLTDYERIDEFVPSVRRSEVKAHLGDGLLLEQEWVTRALFFTRVLRVVLLIREEPDTGILFQDLSGKDFEFYEGSWRIEPASQGVWVRYELRVKPAFSVPGVVARYMLKKSAEDLLGEVRSEILRRGKQAAGVPTRMTSPSFAISALAREPSVSAYKEESNT